MRLSLFFSAVLATSLFAGGAMADRPGEGGGRTARVPVREMRIHAPKEMRQVQPAETRAARVRDTAATERFRNRGDVVDRYAGAGSAAAAKAANNPATIKAQRNAEKALERLNARKTQVINCSPTDDSCGQSSRAAAAGGRAAVQNQKNAAAAQQKRDNNMQRAEIQKKIDERRAQRLKARLLQKMCEMKASTCKADL